MNWEQIDTLVEPALRRECEKRGWTLGTHAKQPRWWAWRTKNGLPGWTSPGVFTEAFANPEALLEAIDWEESERRAWGIDALEAENAKGGGR